MNLLRHLGIFIESKDSKDSEDLKYLKDLIAKKNRKTQKTKYSATYHKYLSRALSGISRLFGLFLSLGFWVFRVLKI